MKIIYSILTVVTIPLVTLLFYFFPLTKLTNYVRGIAKFSLIQATKKSEILIIRRIVRKIHKIINVKSCLRICITEKIILSIFGFKTKIISGIKYDKHNRLLGHAWLVYNDRDCLYKNEKVHDYIKSFEI